MMAWVLALLARLLGAKTTRARVVWRVDVR